MDEPCQSTVSLFSNLLPSVFGSFQHGLMPTGRNKSTCVPGAGLIPATVCWFPYKGNLDMVERAVVSTWIFVAKLSG